MLLRIKASGKVEDFCGDFVQHALASGIAERVEPENEKPPVVLTASITPPAAAVIPQPVPRRSRMGRRQGKALHG